MNERDRREFGEFAAAGSGALTGLAYVLTGDQHAAEDLLQTALTRAAGRWGRIHSAPEAYVRQIMYREQISSWRRRARRRETTMADPPDQAAVPDTGAEARLIVREALRALPAGKRAVLVLRYLEDLPEAQVARVVAAAADAPAGPLWNLFMTWALPERTLADLSGWYWDQNRGRTVARSAQKLAAGAAADPGSAGPPGRKRLRADPTLLYVIKQVELAARAQLDEIFRPIGMTALQYTALTVLEHHPDMSSAQLARNSFVTAQTMADMVRALEERGLVDRHRDAADRRRLVLALTGDGRELLRRYRSRVAALEERMLSGLTAEQAVELRRGLAMCRANLAGR